MAKKGEMDEKQQEAKDMRCIRYMFFYVLLGLALFFRADGVRADLVLQSEKAGEVELTGYDGLQEQELFKGTLTAEAKQHIKTSYQGLALLKFAKGQQYPLILNDQTFTVTFTDPMAPPVFIGSGENDFFYKVLTNHVEQKHEDVPAGATYPFVALLLQARELIQASRSITTTAQLHEQKKLFHDFVRAQYTSLRHSDMLQQLLAQYFMMHEYVSYHTEGDPAADIQRKYMQEVLNGVKDWLAVLRPLVPENEVLNYCVGLYYRRSMVSLAAVIIDQFPDHAWCAGQKKEQFNFPPSLNVTAPDSVISSNLSKFRGQRLVAFVSEKCPVSLVQTVRTARRIAEQHKPTMLFVAPLEPLGPAHLALRNMVSGGAMLFIDDEQWRQANLAEKIRLPLFIRAEGKEEGP
ncbi:MAG: hypothetical protein D3916_10335 [Candidatus Electrothrix sp. MAN1_4]|nr:hypothetical protein [Candidatus Electrothrix sp. MAN1_4]